MAQAFDNHRASGGTSYHTPSSVSRSSGDRDAETVMRDVTSRVIAGERAASEDNDERAVMRDVTARVIAGERAASGDSVIKTITPTTLVQSQTTLEQSLLPPSRPTEHVTGFTLEPTGGRVTPDVGAFMLDVETPKQPQATLSDFMSGAEKPEVTVVTSYVPSSSSRDYEFTGATTQDVQTVMDTVTRSVLERSNSDNGGGTLSPMPRPTNLGSSGGSDGSFTITPQGKLEANVGDFVLNMPERPAATRSDFETAVLEKPITQASGTPSFEVSDYREPIDFRGPEPRVDTQAQSVLTQVRQARMDQELDKAITNPDADVNFTITPTGLPLELNPGEFTVDPAAGGRNPTLEMIQRLPPGLAINGLNIFVAEKMDGLASLAPGGMAGKFLAKTAIADINGRLLSPLAKAATDKGFEAIGQEIQDPIPPNTSYEGGYGARGFFDIIPGGISAGFGIATSRAATELVLAAGATGATALAVPIAVGSVISAGAYVAADMALPQETQERLLNAGAEAVSDRFVAPRAGASLADSFSEQYNLGPSVDDLPDITPGALENFYNQQEAGLFM